MRTMVRNRFTRPTGEPEPKERSRQAPPVRFVQRPRQSVIVRKGTAPWQCFDRESRACLEAEKERLDDTSRQ